MMKRILALVFVAVMLLSCVTALADASWRCESCGVEGNTGKFCPQCAAARPEATPKPAASGSVRVGEYVTFGRYEQDNNEVTGKEDLEWLVLDVQGDKALLISRYGLYRSTFNPRSNKQTWATSGLRIWLNKTFYNEAFTSAEKDAILVTFVDDSISTCDPSKAPKRLGDSTNDKVFLLSYTEMMEYLPTDYDRMCVPTKKAVAEGCNVSDRRYLDAEYKTCWYWMRSPAYNNNILVVDWTGVIESCYMNHTYGVVRPVIWVETYALN